MHITECLAVSYTGMGRSDAMMIRRDYFHQGPDVSLCGPPQGKSESSEVHVHELTCRSSSLVRFEVAVCLVDLQVGYVPWA
jgi:hypothetical protein